jgi:DNA-binding protein H-NS
VIKKANFASMSVEELWGIHEEVSKLLEAKMRAEKKILEQRLISLHPAALADRLKVRRPYPPVLPKFANPDEPSQVWAGRGKRPRWVIEKLATGLVLEDLSIGRGSSVAMPEEHLIGSRKASQKGSSNSDPRGSRAQR